MKQLSFLLFLFFKLNGAISAQEKTCEVVMDAIKGSYTGACVDGKAHGKGKSVGTDVFDGDFKNGYPDGFGEYTWQNGDHYRGNWKKGRMEGTGEMTYKVRSGDSIVPGFWKKGKYVGLYEKPYEVVSTTSHITKINISRINKSGQDINITMHQLSNSTRGLTYLAVSNIVTLKGTYFSKNNQSMYNSGITKIQQVVFPFRAILTLNNGESAEILINEKGYYEVYIDME